MTITEAAKHFGNRAKMARALGISPAAVYQRQKESGDSLPEAWAMRLHFITNAELPYKPKENQE